MNQVFFVTFYFSIYHSTISRFFLFVGNPVLRVLSNIVEKLLVTSPRTLQGRLAS
jgi:hypothetical protein